jgi:hypothetical protein
MVEPLTSDPLRIAGPTLDTIPILYYPWDPPHKQALGNVVNPVRALTHGRLAPAFWGGLVTVALVIPFILEAVKGYASISPAAMPALAVTSSVIGLVGGFMLRHVIVYGGTRVPLNVRGVSVPHPPEEYEVNAIQQASYSSFQKR